jgi:hypothetical protein
MTHQPILQTQRKESRRQRRYDLVGGDGPRGIIDKEKNAPAWADGMILRFRVEWRHVDQVTTRRVPHGVVYSNEVSEAGVVREVLVLEHPAALCPATVLLYLAVHVLEASQLMAPRLRAVLSQAKWLGAYRGSERSYSFFEIGI